MARQKYSFESYVVVNCNFTVQSYSTQAAVRRSTGQEFWIGRQDNVTNSGNLAYQQYLIFKRLVKLSEQANN